MLGDAGLVAHERHGTRRIYRIDRGLRPHRLAIPLPVPALFSLVLLGSLTTAYAVAR